MIELAGATHAGRQRASNEDRIAIDSRLGLAVIADGLGGERGGDVAAACACQTIAEAVRRGSDLATALRLASSRIEELAVGDLHGMGATVAAFRIDHPSSTMQVAHAGDVRVYVERSIGASPLEPAQPRFCPPSTAGGNVLVCMTRDHTSICELVERGHLDLESAARHPLRSRVTRVLGRSGCEPEVCSIELVPGDRVLACTDGLWGLASSAAIATIVAEARSPELACEALIALALDAGGTDNIGIVVARCS